MAEVPKAGSGFVADVEVSSERLRLLAIETGYGVVANLYSLTESRWLFAPHYFSTIKVARRWAEWELREHLRSTRSAVPRVKWLSTDSQLRETKPRAVKSASPR
jgi:hypothetical protein